MILCLVTDRRRLGAALRLGPGEWFDAVRAQVFAAAAAGIDLVQLREPDLEAADLLRLAKTLVADTAHTPTRIIVNDRLDVALASGAAGVHLKERSFSNGQCRVSRGMLITWWRARCSRRCRSRRLRAWGGKGWRPWFDLPLAGRCWRLAGSTCRRSRLWSLVAQRGWLPSVPSFQSRGKAWLSLCKNE